MRLKGTKAQSMKYLMWMQNMSNPYGIWCGFWATEYFWNFFIQKHIDNLFKIKNK